MPFQIIDDDPPSGGFKLLDDGPDVNQDVAKSILTGVKGLATGTVGLPGSVEGLAGQGVDMAAEAMGSDYRYPRMLPNISEVNAAVDPYLPEALKHEPQTTQGKIASWGPDVAALAMGRPSAKTVATALRGGGKLAEAAAAPVGWWTGNYWAYRGLKAGGRASQTAADALSPRVARGIDDLVNTGGRSKDDIIKSLVDLLQKQRGSSGGRGVRSGASPHDRVNSIADALRSNPEGTFTPEKYRKVAATWERRAKSYEHRANVARDHPEDY